jgi:hypothetical protein
MTEKAKTMFACKAYNLQLSIQISLNFAISLKSDATLTDVLRRFNGASFCEEVQRDPTSLPAHQQILLSIILSKDRKMCLQDVQKCYRSFCNTKHIPAFPDSEVVSMTDLLSTSCYLDNENDQNKQMWVSVHTSCDSIFLKTALMEKFACVGSLLEM